MLPRYIPAAVVETRAVTPTVSPANRNTTTPGRFLSVGTRMAVPQRRCSLPSHAARQRYVCAIVLCILRRVSLRCAFCPKLVHAAYRSADQAQHYEATMYSRAQVNSPICAKDPSKSTALGANISSRPLAHCHLTSCSHHHTKFVPTARGGIQPSPIPSNAITRVIA